MSGTPHPEGLQLVEYTDPGCSWAWGTEPKLRLLRWRYGDRIAWRRVMGGLVADMQNLVDGEFDAERMAPRQSKYWAAVAETTGMPYPARLAWMYRSTELACRAVKAAELQGADVADRVLRRLREATFVFGEPPDTPERIARAVQGVPGLDGDRLLSDLDGDAVRAAFHEDWSETRRPNEYVLRLTEDGPGAGNAKHTEGHWRYVFPTLLIRGPAGERTVPGWKPYKAYVDAIEAVAPGIAADVRADPAPDEVLETWATAAPRELEVLCGPDAAPPQSAVAHDWGDGVFYLSAWEAEARGVPGPAPTRAS